MPAAVDPAVFRQLAEDLAPADLAEVVRRYIEDSAAMLRALEAARRDEPAWRRAAHRLAGGAGGVGAAVVEAAARRLMDAPLPADPGATLDALAADIAASHGALEAAVRSSR